MSAWVNRAVEFTQSLARFGPKVVRSAIAADPLTARQLGTLQSNLSLSIPESLADFLRHESASCDCDYYFTIQHNPTQHNIDLFGSEMAAMFDRTAVFGGASLCQSESFVEWNSEETKSVFDDINSECAELWRSSFLFKSIGNGDFLGLNVTSETDDPPVVYLDHEEEIQRPIAPTLRHFLREWETLCYVCPGPLEFEEFIDQESGYLNSKTGNLDELLALFA